MQTSDYLAAFRVAARARHIDPVTGASSFQSVNLRAEMRQKAPRTPPPRWIDYAPGDDEAVHRPTEFAALLNLHRAARAKRDTLTMPAVQPLQAAA